MPTDPNVVDAELIDENGSPVDHDGHPLPSPEPLFARVGRQAAEGIDSIADAASFVSEEAATELRSRAAQVRGAVAATTVAVEKSKEFLGSASEVVEKLGLRDRLVMVRRERPVR